MSNGNTEIERLVGALRRLRHDQAKRPQSGGLQLVWPDWGRAWIVSWANELDRDLRVIAADLDDARAAPTLDDALVPTENALWRLAAAREKLHAIIALTFGVPSFTVKTPRKTVPGFRVDDKATRARLKGLTQPEAAQVLAADAALKSCLLLRHQLSHSLAPIVNAPSMTWFEVGHVRGGAVYGYEAVALIPGGLQAAELTPDKLLERALRQVQRGLDSLGTAVDRLASLIDAAGELEPPPLIWRAQETGSFYSTRKEASEASRASQRPPGS